MGWKEQLDAAKARKRAAALSSDDVTEMQGREEARREEVEAAEAEDRKAQLDVDRRIDGLGAGHRGVVIKGTGHAFVVKDPGAAAYNAWDKGVSASVISSITGDTKTDRATVSREFAISAVVAWRNGVDGKGAPVWIDDFGATTENGATMREFFKAHPAMVREVTETAVEVAKEAATSRKSGA